VSSLSVGGFFAALGPLGQVYKYLKKAKESREVMRQLNSVLLSLDTMDDFATQAQHAGKAAIEHFENIQVPMSGEEFEELLRLLSEYYDKMRGFLGSFRQLGKECNDLMSPDFEVFMSKVKTNKPEVYEIMTFFARNYNPKNRTLNLEKLPYLIRIYGGKGFWKNDKRLSKRVAEGKQEIRKSIEKVEKLKGQRYVLRDRVVIVGFVNSHRRLASESKRIIVSKNAVNELKSSAPDWFVQLVDATELVRGALPMRSLPRS
jgi:hypothetical protein